MNNKTACFIVTTDNHGNDRVFAGNDSWTLDADKMQRFGARLALEMLRSFAAGFNNARIISADSERGPFITLDANNKLCAI